MLATTVLRNDGTPIEPWMPKRQDTIERRPRRMSRWPMSRSHKPHRVRVMVEFYVGAISPELWKKLKLPAGWRKCPRQKWKNELNLPCRIYSYSPQSLSAEELSLIEAQLGLIGHK